MAELVPISYKEFLGTRSYLRQILLGVSDIQRALTPKEPHSQHYGLSLGMRGPVSRDLKLSEGSNGQILVDLVRSKLRFQDKLWSFKDVPSNEICLELLDLVQQAYPGQAISLSKLEEANKIQFDESLSQKYAANLWWFNDQFELIKRRIKLGSTSMVLLYPHHFDLAFSWFPSGSDHQLTIGFSVGDEYIAEPYIYGSFYPEISKLSRLKLPMGAYWQKDGFQGAIIRQASLISSAGPANLLKEFTDSLVKNFA